jgi:hypothetical protein
MDRRREDIESLRCTQCGRKLLHPWVEKLLLCEAGMTTVPWFLADDLDSARRQFKEACMGSGLCGSCTKE